MFESIQSLLDSFPEGVVQVRNGTVLSANAIARHNLPQLQEGAPLPDCLVLPKNAPSGAGRFTFGPTQYTFSCTQVEEDYVILFRPAPQTALTGPQLDGVLQQLRGFLGEFLTEIGPLTGSDSDVGLPSAAFSKSFYRTFRLMGNLEYMQQSAAGEVAFHPAPLDLDSFCRQVVEQARGPLEQAGIALDYEGLSGGLLISGDAALLRRMLLGLIANSARAAGEGQITLALRRSGSRAVISISDNGPLPDRRQLDALLQQGLSDGIPLANQGAGLGLAIARDIVGLHQGSLLMQWGESSPAVVVSLPTGQLNGSASVRMPRVQRDGGLDPILVELSDVLPAQLFQQAGLD